MRKLPVFRSFLHQVALLKIENHTYLNLFQTSGRYFVTRFGGQKLQFPNEVLVGENCILRMQMHFSLSSCAILYFPGFFLRQVIDNSITCPIFSDQSSVCLIQPTNEVPLFKYKMKSSWLFSKSTYLGACSLSAFS